MSNKTIDVNNDEAEVTLAPLRRGRDYQAVIERLEELEDESGEMCGDDRMEELEILHALAEDFENREGITEETDDFELLQRLPDPETVAIAVFNLSNGNEVRLLGTPETGELSVVEISDAGVEDFVLDERWSPNAIFRRFAPKDGPVPRLLLRLDTLAAFEGRKALDTIPRPIEVDLAALGVQPVAAAVGSGSCQAGAAGAAFFKDHHCDTLGGPGYGKSEGHCYSAAAEYIQKTSSVRRRTTYTRMAACGSGTSRVRHYYKKVSGWNTQLTIHVQPAKVVSYWSALKGTGSLRRRRVRFDAIQQGAWVRGWVKFHTQCAGGWF
jgi:hypothetical protein